jgi:hypothetical protein
VAHVGPEPLGCRVASNQDPLFCVFILVGTMDFAALSVRPLDAHRLESPIALGNRKCAYFGRNLATNIIGYGR